MKKNNFVKITVVIVCMAGCLSWHIHNKKAMNNLVMDNIEALAAGEDSSHDYCYGTGDIDCLGVKVKRKIDDYSLKMK